MKSARILLPVLIIGLLASCRATQGVVGMESTPAGNSLEFFREGYFQAILPDWEETPERDPETIHMVYKDGQFIGINSYRNLPELFARQFLGYIEGDPSAFLVQQSQLDGKPFFEYTKRENDQTMRFQAVLDYCQGQTYLIFAGGKETVENAALFQEVLTSSSCQDPYQVPTLETGKIGLMVNPALDEPLEGFYPALRLAKENGVQVLHSYLQWGDVEPTIGERAWDWQDFQMGYRLHEGFQISLVVNLIHTGVRGPMPDDLAGKAFDDPEFIQRFGDFILEVLERYPVDYLAIGNEVNDYFVTHRHEIPDYAAFFLAIRDRIREAYPDLPVGMTFAYHDAESTNSVDIIQRLNLGDFLPVTLYFYNSGFQFTRDPAELADSIERILAVADGKPIAIVETGWSTAETLSGSQEDQEAYLREVFRQLAGHRERIEYISWFALHDSKLENSYQSALTFLPPDSFLTQDAAFMTDFVDFLNYFGLRENDGTPKSAWFAFEQEAARYLATYGGEQ